MEPAEIKKAWGVFVNTDLTEGRGRIYCKHLCWSEATAIRLAKGADVQGSNGRVEPVSVERRGDGVWLGPVQIENPTSADMNADDRIAAQRAIEDRARAAGLSEDDISALRRSPA